MNIEVHPVEEDKKIIEEIRKQTRSGKPLGDPEFLTTLSERLGRSLSFRPKGRPRKRGYQDPRISANQESERKPF
jgi:hypothetical protein